MTKFNYKKNYNQCSYFNDKLKIIIEVKLVEDKNHSQILSNLGSTLDMKQATTLSWLGEIKP
jgi:hypothetical protein